jgi:hypothetical protein
MWENVNEAKNATYFKKASAHGNCDDEDFIESINDCKKASSALGYNYAKTVDTDGRPPGCYWHQDGNFYYNKNFTGKATWNKDRVGAVCMTE